MRKHGAINQNVMSSKTKTINFEFQTEIVNKWVNGKPVLGTLTIEAQAECYDNDLSDISTEVTKVIYKGMDITPIWTAFEFGNIQEEAETKAEGLFHSEGAVIRSKENFELDPHFIVDSLFETIASITDNYVKNITSQDQKKTA